MTASSLSLTCIACALDSSLVGAFASCLTITPSSLTCMACALDSSLVGASASSLTITPSSSTCIACALDSSCEALVFVLPVVLVFVLPVVLVFLLPVGATLSNAASKLAPNAIVRIASACSAWTTRGSSSVHCAFSAIANLLAHMNTDGEWWAAATSLPSAAVTALLCKRHWGDGVLSTSLLICALTSCIIWLMLSTCSTDLSRLFTTCCNSLKLCEI